MCARTVRMSLQNNLIREDERNTTTTKKRKLKAIIAK
jgi:hypothetical protein